MLYEPFCLVKCLGPVSVMIFHYVSEDVCKPVHTHARALSLLPYEPPCQLNADAKRARELFITPTARHRFIIQALNK